MRINQYLSQAGVCSRRQAETYIKAGRVKVNDQVVINLSTKVNPDADEVQFDNVVIKLRDSRIVYILNKPKGVVTTASDPENRKTVLDFIPKSPRVFPCGRLDENSQGLVVLTNDGTLCYQLTHPKFEHRKEYIVQGKSKTPLSAFEIIKSGVVLSDGPANIDELKLIKKSKDWIEFLIVVHEGRNRLVRRICARAGIEVVNLTRTKLGRYELGQLAPGEWQIVND